MEKEWSRIWNWWRSTPTVRNISFVGNKVFSDRRLKEVISTKQTACGDLTFR